MNFKIRACPTELRWHSGLPIYASPQFLESVSDDYGWLGGTDEEGQLRCILPYTIVRKPGFRFVRFRVETIPLRDPFDADEEREFLGSAIQYFRAIGADMIVPAANSALFRTYPDGAVVSPYGTIINRLDQSEEALFGQIKPDYRNKIRSATKAGVRILTGMEYLDVAYQIIADTLKRSGADTIRSYQDLRKTIVALGQNVRILVAEYRGKIHACLITPFSARSAYSMYAGTVREPQKGAMHLMHWEAMRQFRSEGLEIFNFQGVRINPGADSKQAGILTFKQRFGGSLIRGYVWKYPLRAAKSAVYSLAVRVMMGGDIVDHERNRTINTKSEEATR